MDLFVELNELMVKYRFRPNKKMAQLFIIDGEAIQKIVEEAELSGKDRVLEIGGGTGFLTRELQKKCHTVAVELDDSLFRLLGEELPKKNLELVHGDFLAAELPKFNKVVSFPPYTISSGIMWRLFELKPELCVLVFQREFVEKLSAQPGFTEYNALSVLTQYYFKTEVVGNVPSSRFFPRPRSDSAIIKLSFRETQGKAVNEQAFNAFVKSVFRFQNKNVLNAVKNSLPFLKNHLVGQDKVIAKLEKSRFAREKVNILSPSDFVELFNLICAEK